MKKTISTFLVAMLLTSSTAAMTYADDTAEAVIQVKSTASEEAQNNLTNESPSLTAKADEANSNPNGTVDSSTGGTANNTGSSDGTGDGANDNTSNGTNDGAGSNTEGTGDGGSSDSGDSSAGNNGGNNQDNNAATPQPQKPQYVNKFVKRGGYTYYYGSNGTLIKSSLRKIQSNYYYFNSTGRMQTSKWIQYKGKKYYLQSSGRACKSCTKKIGRYTYRFSKYGQMYAKKWYRNSKGYRYYFNKYGRKVYGTQNIGGKKYFFNKSGILVASNGMDVKAQNYSSSTKYLILVNTKTNVARIYTGKNKNWRCIKNWSCTTGKSSTPTVKGSFIIGKRGNSFGHGYTCWYWTQFKNDYLFHSVIYNPGSKSSVQDGRLGKNLSHGCVRLSIANAKWLHDKIPSGTKTIVY